jgi:transcriptional regulator with XRE-family HTH domain
MEITNQPTQIYLHTNIRCLRKQMNLSQEELAGKVGLNRGNIASYEKGSAEPKICNLVRLANFFEISIIDLTKKDLSNSETFNQAHTTYQKLSNSDQELIEQFFLKSQEIQEVIQSLHCCHQFKTRSINDMPKDMQIMMMNFEQLFDASQMLMRNHQALMDFIKCRLK